MTIGSEHDSGGELLFSIGAYVPPESLTAGKWDVSILSDNFRTRVLTNGGWHVYLVHHSFDQSVEKELGEAVTEATRVMVEKLDALNVTSEFLKATRCKFRISMSLCPQMVPVNFSLSPQTLRIWRDLGVDLFLDVLQ